jgi:hypothetical protein
VGRVYLGQAKTLYQRVAAKRVHMIDSEAALNQHAGLAGHCPPRATYDAYRNAESDVNGSAAGR